MEEQQPLPYDPVVEAIRLLARRGRELREAPRNAVYEGMTPEERGIAVYKKWQDGELSIADMTELEWRSWLIEEEIQGRRRDNWLWNHEQHRHLMKRVYSLKAKLTEDERRAINDLLELCEWGRDEVDQVKEIVETAEWLSGLRK